jgi:AAA+ superfamily predicted ATPase
MEKLPMYHPIKLPHDPFQKRGKSIILARQSKHLLVRYAEYRLIHMPRDSDRFGCNGLVTLAGDPGTGKSVTARWFADAAVRALGTAGQALLINASGLFDHLLGNSQKIVASLFDDIGAAAVRGPVVAIWDDAEGVLMSRQQSMDSNDPTDCVRVSTELFAGLDRLRDASNVIH